MWNDDVYLFYCPSFTFLYYGNKATNAKWNENNAIFNKSKKKRRRNDSEAAVWKTARKLDD